MIVVYIVLFGALIYFLMIRPSRKQKKEAEARNSGLEPGDSVLTTSGFYGTIVAVNGDTVIVEFGNNKNCRIPMSKQAISQVEKANAAVAQPSSSAAPAGDSSKSQESSKRKFFGKGKAAAEEEQARAEAEAAKAAQAAEEKVEEAVSDAVEEVKDTAAEVVDEVKPDDK
ncbi:MAG: preprotein translocase subunit YajC [Lachnospiraceae bacterium]|nr:preprotein translocase subunit YajC [Lachnospiraceae bacterium]MBR3005006.1 preprotein translocase subunit YajC [Lachnospiraceae bacterium]MBR6350470.1 preprotein translocase subunit YajC [Lachnospiraceae bacterium]